MSNLKILESWNQSENLIINPIIRFKHQLRETKIEKVWIIIITLYVNLINLYSTIYTLKIQLKKIPPLMDAFI